MSALVIFDFDGTLADTWRDIATALDRTLSAAGLPRPADADLRAWIGRGVRALVADALPESRRAPAHIDALVARFRLHYEDCCLDTTVLYPGIVECLDALAPRRLAILSNKPGRFLDRISAGLGIAARFTAIVGGDALATPKPDAAAIAYVVRGAGKPPPRDVWMVGDSAIDVAAGRAAGARTIGCTWGLRPERELRAAGAEHIIDHPSAIAPLLQR